jgi:hypothetical protein
MAHSLLKHFFLTGALCAGSALVLSSCIDDSYDLDKVDLTMGLGSDGLSVTLGNTEKIRLGDLLDLDESVKLDGKNTFYLVEDGNTNFDVKVDKVHTNLNSTTLKTNEKVLSYEKARQQLESLGISIPTGGVLPIPAGQSFTSGAEGDESIDFKVNGITGISHINTLYLQSNNGGIPKVALSIIEKRSSPNIKFGVSKLENMSITLPEFMHVTHLSNGWTRNGRVITCASMDYHMGTPICEVTFDEASLNATPVNGELQLTPEQLNIHMEGKVTFKSTAAFSMGEHDYADVELNINMGNEGIDVYKVKGVFNPEINPENSVIDIKESLPDFLTDDAVVIKASNPTIRFDANLSSIPVGVQLGNETQGRLIELTAEKGTEQKSVNLPYATIENGKVNTIYYYQGTSPYDPAGQLIAGAQQKTTPNLGTLIEKLPDQITVKMDDHRLEVKNQEYTVELGRNYNATVNYNVFVPFAFDKGFTIVYNDSTDSMNDDLKKYAAKGIQIKAEAQNAVPLDLIVGIEAKDVNGQVIDGIKFNDVTVPAGPDTYDAQNEPIATTAPITLEATLADEKLLSKVDKLIFKVHAADNDELQSKTLVSTQYLRLATIKLRLKGGVTADFN